MAFLRSARAHLRPGGVLACAIVTAVEPFDCARGQLGPAPETTTVGGDRYVSRPTRVNVNAERVLIERERRIYPLGAEDSDPGTLIGRGPAVLFSERHTDELATLSAAALQSEGIGAGLAVREVLEIAAVHEDARAGGAGSGVLRVCALYPDLMNIYADRGNLLVLERRCAWRGIAFELSSSALGDSLDPDAHDLFYLGGGQDSDQRLCAEDLIANKRAALHEAADRGAVVLGVCGGYQLLGRSYTLGDEQIEGVGLVDVHTVRDEGPRLIGNIAIEVSLDGKTGVLAGFENHGGRTALGPGEQALGRVLKGFGNDGASGYEGVRRENTIGTYLHGPLLPKNVWFADWLISRALAIDAAELPELDDGLERAGHESARTAAGV
jgi:hypothetical protein